MRKITPLNGRLVVKSRGTNEGDGVIIPEKFLLNSNVCSVDPCGTIIVKDENSGLEIGECEYIIDSTDVLATLKDDEWIPNGKWILARKAIDPEDDSGVITPYTRSTRFAEILAAGDRSGLQSDIGKFAHVDESIRAPQKVEETFDDWFIHSDAIEFVIGE